MLHDMSKRIPLWAHLDLREECLILVSRCITVEEMEEGHARTERKARAAPSIEAIEAMRNPGHIPYVNPISDIEPAKPNRGG